MKKEREVYFPTKAKRSETFIPKRITARRKKKARRKKTGDYVRKKTKSLGKPAVKGGLKKGKRGGVVPKATVQRGIKSLWDLI